MQDIRDGKEMPIKEVDSWPTPKALLQRFQAESDLDEVRLLERPSGARNFQHVLSVTRPANRDKRRRARKRAKMARRRTRRR